MLAMNGIGDGLAALHTAIVWIGLLIFVGGSLIAICIKSELLLALALCSVLFFGSFVPWSSPFVELSAYDREDPDVVDAYDDIRRATVAWYIGAFATVPSAIVFVVLSHQLPSTALRKREDRA